MTSAEPIRLNTQQLHRAVMAAGGLWTTGEIAKVVGRSRVAVWRNWRGIPEFPSPVCQSGRYSFYAGEDVLDFLETTGRYDGAQRFSEAIQQMRVTEKFGEKLSPSLRKAAS